MALDVSRYTLVSASTDRRTADVFCAPCAERRGAVMTLIEAIARPSTCGRARSPRVAQVDGSAVITDTTELRWFADEQLPREIEAWFTCDGSRGLVEQRTDTYRIDGRRDTGVKRRFGETLELKARRAVGERLVLGRGLSGRVEVWRRWSPAECSAIGGVSVPWSDVHKTVFKRRFSTQGDEVELTVDNRTMNGAGCDVEIAAVEVDDVHAWTFAFAAFGPVEGRRRSIVLSFAALTEGSNRVEQVGPLSSVCCGYPEWLASRVRCCGAASTCDLRLR